ncbi:hypothetical protein [Nonomuraea sp. NPDC002799]
MQSTPDPPPAAQDMCAPGSSGNTHPSCGPRPERGTIAGGEDLTVEDLAERVIDGGDAALDATELGLELCTDSLGCARITGFVEATSDIGFATGAIGVVIDCESQGWTSQACVKGAILEGGQLIPGVGGRLPHPGRAGPVRARGSRHRLPAADVHQRRPQPRADV